MPKQESRAPVQICSVIAPDDVAGLYVLASDGSIWRYGTFKDLNYWSPLERLPPGEDPPPLPDTTRHELLCAALRELDDIGQRTTGVVVEACRGVVSDCTSTEIMVALRALGRPL